jgi:hypothetical protein
MCTPTDSRSRYRSNCICIASGDSAVACKTTIAAAALTFIFCTLSLFTGIGVALCYTAILIRSINFNCKQFIPALSICTSLFLFAATIDWSLGFYLIFPFNLDFDASWYIILIASIISIITNIFICKQIKSTNDHDDVSLQQNETPYIRQ